MPAQKLPLMKDGQPTGWSIVPAAQTETAEPAPRPRDKVDQMYKRIGLDEELDIFQNSHQFNCMGSTGDVSYFYFRGICINVITHFPGAILRPLQQLFHIYAENNSVIPDGATLYEGEDCNWYEWQEDQADQLAEYILSRPLNPHAVSPYYYNLRYN